MDVLSIWTGAWVGRAGILAEMCSFPLLAPEILGPNRLKRVEEALRSGLDNPSVRRAAIAVWLVLFALVVIALDSVMPILFWHPSLLALIVTAVASPTVFFSIMFSAACRAFVRSRLREQELEGDALHTIQGEMARATVIVLNVGQFRRVARPRWWEWGFWAIGIPFHIVAFVGYFIIPKGILAIVHLQQRLLASGVGLRSLVVGTGIVLFFGGMVAQFVATF